MCPLRYSSAKKPGNEFRRPSKALPARLTGIPYLTNDKSTAFMGKDDNMAAVRGERGAFQITARIFRGRFVCACDAHRSVCNRTCYHGANARIYERKQIP